MLPLNTELDPRPVRRMLLLVAAFLCCGGLSTLVPAADDATSATVSVVVDYGDGAELHLKGLPWKQGMTALDAVKLAQAHAHGVAFAMRGAGTTAFVTKIGDVVNEGSGRTSRNWMFHVGKSQPDEGIGSYELKSGDVVLWKFETFAYN